MLLVGLRALLGRALARVLDRQRGGDHQDLPYDAQSLGLEDHPAEPRVDGKARETLADLGQPALATDRAQLLQQLHPVGDVARSGGSTNGNRPMSPSLSDVIWRMTEARLVRRISGSVNTGRDS